MKLYMIHELYDRTGGKTFIQEPEVKALNEAMWQSEEAMRSMKGIHDDTGFEEEEIYKFAEQHGFKFDINGNLICWE